jgi:hypothetical protein
MSMENKMTARVNHFDRYRVATKDIARAAGWDAGDRNARANGRQKWTVDDYNAAVAEFNRILPERHVEG